MFSVTTYDTTIIYIGNNIGNILDNLDSYVNTYVRIYVRYNIGNFIWQPVRILNDL